MNFPVYVIMAKNRWSSLTEFGNGIFVIASSFAGPTLCLQMIKYVQEIQWTLPQFDISFYLVLVLSWESSKTLYLKVHYVWQEFYPILLYHLGS